MDWKSVLLGLVVGLGAGWVGGTWMHRDAGDTPDTAHTSESEAAIPATVTSPHLEGEGSTATPTQPAQTPSTASATSTHDTSVPAPSAPDVDVILARLTKADTERDWPAFRKALTDMAHAAQAGSIEAQKVLLEVMKDGDRRFPTRMGRTFLVGLEASELPGIAEAALAHAAASVANGNTSWTAVDGWDQLVANSGSPDTFEALLALADDGQIANRTRRALATSTNRDAAAFLLAWLHEQPERDEDARLLEKLSRSHPELVYEALSSPTAWAALEATDVTRDRKRSTLRRRLRALMHAAPTDEVDALLSRANRLPRAMRVQAVYGVQALIERGIDPTGADLVLGAPIDVLDDYARAQDPRALASDARQAMYAIEYNPVLHTEEILESLLAFRATLSGNERRSEPLEELIKEIEAKLETDASWKRNG